MPRLRRRQLRIPNLRYIGQSRSNKCRSNRPHSCQNHVRESTVAHEASSDQLLIRSTPIATTQNEFNLEDNPLLSKEDAKDTSHHCTDALTQHYLKNMNSMKATTNGSGRVNQEDDDTSLTPIISNCYQDEKSNITPSVSNCPRDDMSSLSYVTPIMSNCNNTTRESSIPTVEDTAFHGSDATEESKQSDITSRRKSGIKRVKCESMFEEIVLPVLVTTLYFTALLLSSYASLSCKFMTCNLDFIPINIKIGQTDLNVGPWAFSALSGDGDNIRCLRYPNDFSEIYIETDSWWKATRATSVLTIVIGWIGFVVISVAVSRTSAIVSTRFFQILDTYWKVCIIGLAILLIILECVMFSFQSVDMCKDTKMWMRDDGEYLAADKCSLSTGAFCSIFAMIFYGFVMILLISAPICPFMDNKDQIGTNTERTQLDTDRVSLVEEELNSNHINSRYCADGYAYVSDNSCGESLESVEDFPIDDTDLKELESRQFSTKPAVSFKPNMASSQHT